MGEDATPLLILGALVLLPGILGRAAGAVAGAAQAAWDWVTPNVRGPAIVPGDPLGTAYNAAAQGLWDPFAAGRGATDFIAGQLPGGAGGPEWDWLWGDAWRRTPTYRDDWAHGVQGPSIMPGDYT